MLQQSPNHLHLDAVVVGLAHHFFALSLIQKIHQDQSIVCGQGLNKGLPAYAGHHDAVEQDQGPALAMGFKIDVSAVHFKCRHKGHHPFTFRSAAACMAAADLYNILIT